MRTRFLFFFFLFSISAFTQSPFQDISFAEALQQAKEENKMIFLQFESATCKQCNEVAIKGLSNQVLSKRLQEIFICLSISATHPDRNQIGSLFNIEKGFGSLFLNSNGTIVYSFHRTTSRSDEYHRQIDIALVKAGENLQINQVEEEYKKGYREIAFLEMFLDNKRKLGLPTDELLDEYVSLLPADSLQSARTIQFIAQMAPIIGSKADKMMRNNRPAFSNAWYLMTLSLRTNINQRIIYKSLNKAINEKDETYAIQTASFARNSYGPNYNGGLKEYEMRMLEFYRQTNDTTKYIKKAIGYFERFFMDTSSDAVKNRDSLYIARVLAQNKRKDTIIIGGSAVIKTIASLRPMAPRFAGELNNGAWCFYKMTRDPYLLSLATEWVKKALEVFESPETLDTYARLLYLQKQKVKAIELETKAVALKIKKGYAAKDYEDVLAKMKQNATNID